MSDLASLFIRVDSSGVVTASRSLDELAGKSQKVEEATRKVTKATDSAASSMGKYITAAAATAAVMKLIQQSVQAFMEAEKATLRMAMAMKNQGDFSRAALNDLKAYASQLQKVTAYEDDATLSLMANLKSYGMTNEEVKKATKVAMDFASAKQAEGMSVSTAAELLGKAYAGNTQTLTRYGIVVGEIKDKSEKYNAVMKQLEQRFGGSAQAELLTYSGQWQKLKNQWSDIQEFLGIIFLKTLQAVQVAAGLVGVAFMSVGSKILQVLDILLTPLRGILMLVGLVAGALGADGLSSALNLAASAISDARARILDAKDGTMAWTSANYDQLKSFDGIETAVEKMGNTGTRTTYNLAEGTDKATKAAQKLREEWAKLKAELDFEKATAGMDDLDKALAEIERDMTKMRSNPNADLKLIDEIELQRQSTAIKAWYDEYLQEQIKAKENFDRQEKAKQDSIAKGERETLDAIKKQYDADGQLLRDKLELYKDLTGFEDEYRQVQLEWIERIKNENIKATGDVLAAEEKAAKDKTRIEYDLLRVKLNSISEGFGSLSSSFREMSDIYDEGSSAAMRWQEAAKAMEIAQKAVAVVNAVAAVAAASAAPFPAGFVSGAAMLASMASLLASIGASIGGGGGSSVKSAPSYAFSSSVLGGEAGAESESLKKSWEYLEDTYDMEYEKLTKIHNELKDLNDNITGLVTSIIRTGSVGSIPFEEHDPQTMLKFMNSDLGFALTSPLVVLGPLGKMMSDGINKLFEGLFGGGAFAVGKTELWSSSTGIKLGGGRAGDIAGGAGVNARSYQEWTTRTTTDFWREDSYDYNYREQALAQETQNLFNSVFKNVSEVLVELSTGLGQDVNKALNYVFSPATINLAGMSSEQISSTLNAYISSVGDTAVQALFGQVLAGYQELGEGLMETAVRLMVDKEIVLEVLAQTNQAYSGSTANAIELSEALIKLAGDLETLTDIASTYYDKFFTEEEKHLRLQEQLTTILGSLNIALPETRQAYRDIVESLDLTTASGQTAYITLLKLAESADTYYSTLEDMADDLVSAAELAAQAIKDVLDATNTAIGEQISLAGAAASAARSAANEYRNIIKSLTDAQESIRGGSAAEMQQRFESLFATAMTGDREALSALPGAADKAMAGSLASSKSAVDYARDQGKMLLALEQAKTISAAMVDWNEYHATLLETQVNVLEQIRDELALENPNLEALERQAGLLESIGGLLQQQTTAIVNGNGEQALLMIDQTGKIVLANKLTTDQTGKITLGNSWLSGIASGTSAQLIADATTSVTAHNDSEVIKQQIATGSLNITTSQAVNAAEIGKSLTTAQVALIDNNRVEAQQARAAMAMLEKTTKDGLITTAEAKATTDAIAVLRNSTSNLLSQEILATNKAVSETITQADKAVQATLQVRTAVTSGAEFSADTIGTYLTEVEASLVDNNSKEAVAARKTIEALKVATADGLIKTAEAKATKDAITVLQNVTTGILSQGVKLSQSSLSEAAAQASTALTATMGVQETIKYGSKFSADTVGAYLTETETALIGNESAEAAKARESITLLKTITAEGLIKTADAATTKAAIAALQASTSTILNQSLTAQQAAYLSDTVQMAEAIAKTENVSAKVSAAVTSGAAFSAAQIGEYLTGVETTLKDNNTKEAIAARDAIAQLRGVTADGFIATAEAETTTGALSSLQTATASLLKQALDLDNRALSDAAKQAASALDEAIKIEASIGASAAASINEMQKQLTAASNALAGNNSDEAMKARAAIATLQTTTKDGFISTAEAKATTAAITTLQSSTANLLAQEVQAQQATMSAASKQAADAVLATSRVTEAIAAGVNINSAVTIGQYLDEVASAIAANNSTEANQARTAIAELKTATSSGLASTATASATVAALNTLKSTTATILNQSVALEQSAMSATSNQASSALSAALATKDLINLQKAEIINGNLIIRDQNGLITAANQLLVDQTGKITVGNTLTDEQTAQVITGNATSDVIKNLQNLNTSYSYGMLKALVESGGAQGNTMESVLAANTQSVSLLSQLVAMMKTTTALAEAAAAAEAQAQAAAQAKAEADAAAKAAAKAEADRQAAIAQATAAYNQQAAAAETYRAQWDQFATSRASASFRETQEDITKGTAYNVTGYYSYSDAERAWLSQTAAAYQSAFSEAYKLWKAIPGHASGLSYVPTDDYLMRAHEGEAVLTKQEAVEWRNRKSGVTLYTESNAALLAEIKKLNAKIDRLEAISYQTTKNTQKTAKTLEKFDYDGLPAERAA